MELMDWSLLIPMNYKLPITMLKKLLSLILLLSSLTNSFGQSKSEISQAEYVFRHVNVLPISSETTLKNQIVGIQNGKIIFISNDNFTSTLKTKAQIIQGKDKYLMPGMADMHCHFPEKKEIKNYFLMNLLAGVTHLRSMRGDLEHLGYRNQSDYPKPYLQLTTQAIGKSMNITEERADSLVKNSKDKGFDLVKVLSIKDSASFSNLMTASKKYQLPVAGHYLSNIRRQDFIKSGYQTIEHLGGLVEFQKMGDSTFNSIADLTKKNNVYHCPTLDWYQIAYFLLPEETMKKRAGMEYVADSVKTKWAKTLHEDTQKMGEADVKKYHDYYEGLQKKHFEVLKKINDKGINIIAGVDASEIYSVPGFAILEEMKLYSQAGLSNYDILKTATINPAKYAKNEASFGTIEKGKNADLILLEGNPLENLESVSKVNGVFVNQKFYLKEEILKMMK
jgi:Amidohydrolase family